MTNPITAKLRKSLPDIITWIDQTLSDYSNVSTQVSGVPFKQLEEHYGEDFLSRSRVVIVPQVPFPPLSRLGLPEFHGMEKMSLDGVTYKNVFFVRESRQSVSLYFHELVHVAQWARLGVDNFLLAYSVGLVQYGYRKSPLELMAYQLQSRFDQRDVPGNLLKTIGEQTDEIWSVAQSFLA